MTPDHTPLVHFTFRSLPAAVNPAADDQSARHASPPSPRAACPPQPLPHPLSPAGRPGGMFQRFTSALFGDEELSRSSGPGDGKEDEDEEEEDWILVNYLGERPEEVMESLFVFRAV